MMAIDSHFHVWRQADLPWLSGPMQPRIFGPYEAIRRDYPIEEYLADIAGTGVQKAVYVQANWPAEQAEDEVAWLETLAQETGWPHGIVAHADMIAEDVRPALDRMMRHPRLRGIRQQLHWHENPPYRFAAHPDLCRDPGVQRNVARLADCDLVFDLQVFPGQMAGARALAEAAPDTVLVLQHAGMLEDLSRCGPRGMARRHERPGHLPERRGETVGIRHLPPPLRRGAHSVADHRDGGPFRRGPLPLGIEFPHREALDRLRHAVRGAPAGDRRAVGRGTAGDLSRYCKPGLPADLGRNGMGLEIKLLDYGDIELESSFLVLGRDCGRVRRVPVYGFLILGGQYPVVVDTGYRDNAIMATLGMRGLQFHENMIERQLANHGVRPGDVRYVLHTHLHIDHAGKDDHFPMNTTVVINRRELEYSVSGLMHPQYPKPDIIHLVERLHHPGALRLEDLEISGQIELLPGIVARGGGRPYRRVDERARRDRRRAGHDLRRRNLRFQRPGHQPDAQLRPRGISGHGQPWRIEARRKGRDPQADVRKVEISSADPRQAGEDRARPGRGKARLAVPGPTSQSVPRRDWFPA